MIDSSLAGAAQRFYDAIARRAPEQAFLNYGFADPASDPGAGSSADVVRYCCALYEAVLTPLPRVDRILEVGCGRGGGAAFVIESGRTNTYLGVDVSGEHVRACRHRLRSHSTARVEIGDAARLPVADACMDAAFSIEAAHHFADPAKAYREVARALRHGSRFSLAGLWGAGAEADDLLVAAGFRVIERVDITAPVVTSLARTSDARREFVKSLNLPPRFTPLLMSWAGVRGYDAYERLASGRLRYFRYQARLDTPERRF